MKFAITYPKHCMRFKAHFEVAANLYYEQKYKCNTLINLPLGVYLKFIATLCKVWNKFMFDIKSIK